MRRNIVGSVQPQDLVRPLRLGEEHLVQSASVALSVLDERLGGLQEGHVRRAWLRAAAPWPALPGSAAPSSRRPGPAARQRVVLRQLAPRRPVVRQPLDEVRHCEAPVTTLPAIADPAAISATPSRILSRAGGTRTREVAGGETSPTC